MIQMCNLPTVPSILVSFCDQILYQTLGYKDQLFFVSPSLSQGLSSE